MDSKLRKKVTELNGKSVHRIRSDIFLDPEVYNALVLEDPLWKEYIQNVKDTEEYLESCKKEGDYQSFVRWYVGDIMWRTPNHRRRVDSILAEFKADDFVDPWLWQIHCNYRSDKMKELVVKVLRAMSKREIIFFEDKDYVKDKTLIYVTLVESSAEAQRRLSLSLHREPGSYQHNMLRHFRLQFTAFEHKKKQFDEEKALWAQEKTHWVELVDAMNKEFDEWRLRMLAEKKELLHKIELLKVEREAGEVADQMKATYKQMRTGFKLLSELVGGVEAMIEKEESDNINFNPNEWWDECKLAGILSKDFFKFLNDEPLGLGKRVLQQIAAGSIFADEPTLQYERVDLPNANNTHWTLVPPLSTFDLWVDEEDSEEESFVPTKKRKRVVVVE
jgi:hypothetical protein